MMSIAFKNQEAQFPLVGKLFVSQIPSFVGCTPAVLPGGPTNVWNNPPVQVIMTSTFCLAPRITDYGYYIFAHYDDPNQQIRQPNIMHTPRTSAKH